MTKTGIHSTAFVSPTAKLGRDVVIGPFAMVEGEAEIGDHCHIHTHAVVHGRVKMGAGNRVFPHAVIGGDPQDLSFDPATPTFVLVGDNNIFREGVTVNRATAENGATRIGSGCFFMNNSHIAHDCRVGDNTIFASCATIAGHCEVGDRVFFGGGAMVHQFCRIGSFVMVRGTSGINKDVIPYTLVAGQPARHYRLNTVGLKRAGINGDRYRVLSAAFRRLRRRERIDDLEPTPEIVHLREWLAAPSKRGISNFVEVSLGE